MRLAHLPLLLLCASLIEATGGKGGGGGGGKGGGGGGKGGGGGGKGGGGGGKGGGKGGGGGGKKGLHGNWVRHSPSLAGADYSAYYGELYQQPSVDLKQRHSQPNRPVFVPSYPPARYYGGNGIYEKVSGYGKGYGTEYGKGYGEALGRSYYPITQGWYGSYDKGWQGTGGPIGYYKAPDFASEQDDRTAMYIRKGLQGVQDYEGFHRLKKPDDRGQRTY